MTETHPQQVVTKEQMALSVAMLNAGDPDEFLKGYAEDVVVITPVYRRSDEVGEPEIRGKAKFRSDLLHYAKEYRELRLLDVRLNDWGLLLVVQSARGDRITVSVELNEFGLGQRVMVLHTYPERLEALRPE